MAELSVGELRSLKVSEMLSPSLGFGRLHWPQHREEPCVRRELSGFLAPEEPSLCRICTKKDAFLSLHNIEA